MSTRSLTSASFIPWLRLTVCAAFGAWAIPVGENVARALTGWEPGTEQYLWAELALSVFLFAPLAWNVRRVWVPIAMVALGTLSTVLVMRSSLPAAFSLNIGAVGFAVLGGWVAKAIGRR